jgi:hypothetical protein
MIFFIRNISQKVMKHMHAYQGVSKSFRTQSITKQQQQQQTLVQKQHKGLWR